MQLGNAVILRQCQQRGDVVVKFQEGLQPMFWPGPLSSAGAPSAAAADPASSAAAE
jgi:hypothetical protein